MAVPFGSLATNMKDSPAKAVVRSIMQVSPMTEYVPVESTGGSFTHFWNRDQQIQTVTATGLNGSAPSPTNGAQQRYTATAARYSVKMRIDEAMRGVPTQWESEEAKQIRLAGIALGLDITTKFWEADMLTNSLQHNGLDRLMALGLADGTIPSQQRINAGTGGATLTLAMLDQLTDAVPSEGSPIFLNRTMRRKILALARDASAYGIIRISEGRNMFGKKITEYDGRPLRVVERTDNYATPLDFDENDGSGNTDTCSIWAIQFDSQMGCYFFATNGLGLNVDPFVKVPGEHYYDSLTSMIYGLVIAGPRSVGQLNHLNNA